MPAVLVHGVPETSAIWHRLVAALARDDIVTPQMPGFGCARPPGFDATKETYVEWLIGEVEKAAADGPVDLVGHDWGAALVMRLVSLRPDLARTWAVDCAGIASPRFEWHAFAKLWQTAGEGEAFFERQFETSPDEVAPVYAAMGVPEDDARRLVTWTDEVMADCILRLYRSATDIAAEWSPEFNDIAAPGLALLASDEPFVPEDTIREAAERSGARVGELSGVGHWWMLQDPRASAALLEEFWRSVP